MQEVNIEKLLKYDKPIPLFPEEKEYLRTHFLKKHDVIMKWTHWFNAAVWGFQLFTGSALISSSLFKFTPQWWIDMVVDLFGTKANLIRYHILVGIIWSVVLVFNYLFGIKNYTIPFIKRNMVLDKDDILWLINRGLGILGMKVELPPQGEYNAGQKLYAMVAIFGIIFIIITGFIMAFHIGSAEVVKWAILLHFIAVGGVVAGLFVHIYMAAVLWEEHPSLASMITGKVNELYAYHHHFKWWKEMKQKELEVRKKEKEEYLEEAKKMGLISEEQQTN